MSVIFWKDDTLVYKEDLTGITKSLFRTSGLKLTRLRDGGGGGGGGQAVREWICPVKQQRLTLFIRQPRAHCCFAPAVVGEIHTPCCRTTWFVFIAINSNFYTKSTVFKAVATNLKVPCGCRALGPSEHIQDRCCLPLAPLSGSGSSPWGWFLIWKTRVQAFLGTRHLFWSS